MHTRKHRFTQQVRNRSFLCSIKLLSRTVKKGIEAIEQKNIAKKGEYIGKLQDIVIELNNSLDHEIGGEIADELSSLYDYLLFSSTQANIKIDKEPLVGCLNVLNTLYEGWTEAVKQLRKEKAAGPGAGAAK